MGRGRRDGLGIVGGRLVGAMRVPLALGVVLVLLTTAAWGQNHDGWFRVTWTPEANGTTPTPRIEAYVHNDSPYRVTDVRLKVEGLNGDNHPVGQRVVWALGDIDPGGETSFVTETMPGAVTYRMSVVSFDLVSLGQANQAP
jgi:hypothetical protein